jgi:hypothetical protein
MYTSVFVCYRPLVVGKHLNKGTALSLILLLLLILCGRLCGLVARDFGYRSRGPGSEK